MTMLTRVDGPNSAGNKVYTFGDSYVMEVPARYDVKAVIGRGAYGLVCSAVDVESQTLVAIKKISRLFEDAVDAKRVLREIKLLAFFSHPNVLSLYDLPTPRRKDNFNEIYLVTDLMETDMQSLLRDGKKHMKAGHSQFFTVQLLSALQYIHSAHVVHRDLKPGNLLTDSECNLKLCDFGLARGLGEKMTNYVITRWYRPPELLLVCDRYDYEADLWGVGCLAAEMINGKVLFPGRDYVHQINLIVELLGVREVLERVPTGASAEAVAYLKSLPVTPRKPLAAFAPDIRRRFDDESFFDSFEDGEAPDTAALTGADYFSMFDDFLMKLLAFNPRERPTAKTALAHPWLADIMAGMTEVDGCDCPVPFKWELDDSAISVDSLRKLFLAEIEKFQVHGPRLPE